MKIVKVAPVHIWDDVRVFHKEACSLAKSGFEVVLLARADGARKVEGVSVVPVRTSKSSRIARMVMLPVVALQALRLKGDVYHLHNPDSIIVGILLKLFGKKIVYDSHEDFTEKLKVRYWVPAYLRSVLIMLVRHLERIASWLSEFSIATQDEVSKRFTGDVIMLGNLPIIQHQKELEVLEIAKGLEKDISEGEQCKRLVYIGYVNRSRGLFEMLEALTIVNTKQSVRLWLIGPADETDLSRAKLLPGWKYVDYFDRQPQERAFAFVTLSDLGLVVLRDEGGHAFTDPNKLYEYMRFGIPFIASNFDLWMSKFAHLNAGAFVKPSAEDVAGAIDKMLNNPHRKEMGSNGKDFILNNNWDSDYKVLEQAYNDYFARCAPK